MRKLIIIPFLLLIFVACKKESVQTYFIENQQKKEFVSVDISSSILKLSEVLASEKDKKAYQSIQNINVLALPIQRAKEGQYEQEKDRFKQILKGSSYKKLMNFNKDGNAVTLYYIGEVDAIDEIIAYGYSDEQGMGIARILGNKMNPNDIMEMVQNTKLDLKDFDFGQLNNLFK